MNDTYKNGYGLDEYVYKDLINRLYGFEEYYLYGNTLHYEDYLYVFNLLEKISYDNNIDGLLKNAILGWYISFKSLGRGIVTNSVTFKVTNVCQLKCKHCYQQRHTSKNKFMSFEEFIFLWNQHKKLIDFYGLFKSELNADYTVYFEGGEASLNKDLPKMIKYLNEQNIKVFLMTNGIHISDELLNSLKIYKNNKVQVSIDGLRDAHDYIRGVGSFDKSIATVKRLYDNDVNVFCHFVLNDVNYKDFIPLKQYLQENDIYLDGMLYTPKNSIINSLNKKEELLNIIPLFSNKSKNFLGSSICGYGNSISIQENGDISLCLRVGINVGNFFNDSIEKIIMNIKKSTIRFRSVPAYCIDCKNVYKCLGGMLCTKLVYNNILHTEDNICHIFNSKL